VDNKRAGELGKLRKRASGERRPRAPSLEFRREAEIYSRHFSDATTDVIQSNYFAVDLRPGIQKLPMQQDQVWRVCGVAEMQVVQQI
jgi:hypothetical protein